MNYIVLDLEWNQSPAGKENRNNKIPFEIIEIGAIKLDENKEEIDEFNELIKPQVYLELHHITQDIIKLNMDDLQQCRVFKEVIYDFIRWCGKDVIFCTWGDLDLTELQRNMEYYNIKNFFKKPLIFYDIQKIFSLITEGKKNPRSLEYAIDYLKIEKKFPFHQAIEDARYTSNIMQKLDLNVAKEHFSVDYYNNPKCREEEIHLVFDDYSKDILMEFDTKEEAMLDKNARNNSCFLCGKKTSKKLRWFSNNTNRYYCLSYCKEHGYIRGKIRIKKTNEGKYFVVKFLKLASNEEAEQIKRKKEDIKFRRKAKR